MFEPKWTARKNRRKKVRKKIKRIFIETKTNWLNWHVSMHASLYKNVFRLYLCTLICRVKETKGKKLRNDNNRIYLHAFTIHICIRMLHRQRTYHHIYTFTYVTQSYLEVFCCFLSLSLCLSLFTFMFWQCHKLTAWAGLIYTYSLKISFVCRKHLISDLN